MFENDLTKKLREEVNSKTLRINTLKSDHIARAAEKFTADGGCTQCRGRGWIVTWDTLDCIHGSYAQYSSCPEETCTRETRSRSGLSPVRTKYDRYNSGSTWVPKYTEAEEKELQQLQDRVRIAQGEIIAETARWTPSPDKVVRVVRGTGQKKYRSPMGLEGLVVKSFVNNWGTQKLIILDKDGNQHWVKSKEVDVVDPEPCAETWSSANKAHRESNGVPVIVTVKRKSAKAALIRTVQCVELWCPISAAPELKGAKKGQTLSITMPIWLAKKNKIIA
jgi:hypothetical protein